MTRRIARRKSPVHGYGVFACVPIAAGTRILEYRGRRIPVTEVQARFGGTSASGHTFLIALNDAWYIDGGDGGNLSRWINHSCDPNCVAMTWVNIDGIEARDRIFIEALRPIRVGEELSFDYAIELSGYCDDQITACWACACGAKNCRGSMLADS